MSVVVHLVPSFFKQTSRPDLLVDLDIEYVNFDFPAEPYVNPDRAFTLQETITATVENQLLSFGIAPIWHREPRTTVWAGQWSIWRQKSKGFPPFIPTKVWRGSSPGVEEQRKPAQGSSGKLGEPPVSTEKKTGEDQTGRTRSRLGDELSLYEERKTERKPRY